MAPASSASPSGRQGPVRAAVAVLVVGFLVIWLLAPIGNPCPDLRELPAGSTASSSPSFSPPGSRTCTYTAVGGIKATSKYIPWLGWIVLILLAALAGGVVRMASPEGRRARAERGGQQGRERRPGGEPSPDAAPPAGRPPRPARSQRPAKDASERDDAERERARQERAARDRSRRDR
jgi:hypothetical protein